MNEIQRIGFDWVSSSERVPIKGVVERVLEWVDALIAAFADNESA
jgi:hypothetical protein